MDSFKEFTFWDQHLILHTRESLEKFLTAAGFSQISIQGIQRYPLANHLHWLSRFSPGGHESWDFLKDYFLDTAYENKLKSLNMTDTLMAIATK